MSGSLNSEFANKTLNLYPPANIDTGSSWIFFLMPKPINNSDALASALYPSKLLIVSSA